MADLQNVFSWSFSAAGDFEECPRRRYWSKYGAWGGWDRQASADQQKAYQLNKMDNRYSLQGHAVEMAVMWILRQVQNGRSVTAEQAYAEVARPYLNKCFKESRDEQWRQSPKKFCCLREHYYKELDDKSSWAAGIAETTRRCIENFMERVLPRLKDVKPAQEVDIAVPGRTTGDAEHFEIEGIKIYAIPDYVYREGEHLHIIDWKSGKPKPEHQDQLALYGLWAHVKHRIPAENITVYLEYLAEGVTAEDRVTEARLAEVKARVGESVGDMRLYLEGGSLKKNQALPREEWDLAPERRICRFCNFYELCEAELDELGIQ